MKLSFLLCAATLALPATLPLHSALAQPDVRDTVTPMPANRNRAKKAGKNAAPRRGEMMRQNAAKRDQKQIEEFETLFGRKLTDDEKAQIKKAADERDAAVQAAQTAYMAQFLKVTGVTEKELREKRRAARLNAPAAPAAAPAAGTPATPAG